MKTPFNTARSLGRAAAVTLIFAASAVQACSSDAISTGPVSVSRSLPITPEAIQLRVTGTVTDDEGAPVAGAQVILYRWMVSENPHTAVTDNAGLYSISFLSASGISVKTVKDGYQSEWHPHGISPPVDFKFDLPIRRIGK